MYQHFLLLIISSMASATIINSKLSVLRIPADVSEDFPGQCFAWTAEKWYSVNESWSHQPLFCGRSRCTILTSIDTNAAILVEEVTDCGFLIDLEKTPHCTTLMQAYNTGDEYPKCCPVYECSGDDDKIVYHTKAGIPSDHD